MTQYLVMFVLDDGGDEEVTKKALEDDYRQHVYDMWGNGDTVAARPVVVRLTVPVYTADEQECIGDMIAEMQEEVQQREDS